MSMHQEAMHFLQCINKVRTRDDMACVMRLIARLLGFQYFALTQHVDVIAAGSGAIDCVWAGGDKVVEGGRHRLRQAARERFNASVRRLLA